MDRVVKQMPVTIMGRRVEATGLDEVINSFPVSWEEQWQNPMKPCCNVCKTPTEELTHLTRVIRPSELDVDMLEASWECEECAVMDDTWPVITARLRSVKPAWTHRDAKEPTVELVDEDTDELYVTTLMS